MSRRPEDVPVGSEGLSIVRLPGDARRIEAGAFTVDVLADATETGGRFTLIETAESAAGLGPPLHVQHDCAEAFVVLAGRYAMHVDGREFECPAGTFVHVPKGAAHTFRTLEAGSRKLNLYAPAGMVGYFEELAAGIASGMSDADLDAIAERYEMSIVGPIPEGYV